MAIVKYLAEHIDDGLVLLISPPLLNVDECAEELRGYSSREDFGGDDGDDPLVALLTGGKTPAKPNKSRAERLLDMLEKARSDSEAALGRTKCSSSRERECTRLRSCLV